jgi:tRNA-specific 2-thiouridylase
VLIVSKDEKDLLRKEMFVKNVNWQSGKPYSGKCKVKIRSTAKVASATITKIQDTRYKIRFEKPQRAITSGQSAVIYKGNQLIGGGVIM